MSNKYDIDYDTYKEVELNKKENLIKEDIVKTINSVINGISAYSIDKRKLISEYENNDTPILNIFSSGKEFLLLQSYIEIYFGLEELLNFKENFTNLVIDDLNKDFKNKDFMFNYYETNEFIGVIVKMQLEDSSFINIAIIDIFRKELIILENEVEINVNNKINELNITIEELNKQELDLSLAKKNPLYLADGDPMKILKISTRKSKYENQINADIKKINFERNQCLSELADCKAQLEEMNLFLIQLRNFQKYLIDRLWSLYKIEYIQIETEENILNENINYEEKTDTNIMYF